MFEHSVQFGWLDLSEAEQRRAREYLRQFRTEGTIDELGFGIIRDAFADVFFPATSTIMTRSRYLFFVAAIFLRIERERLSGTAAQKRLKQLEDELRQILSRDSDEGVIGALAKENLRRYPSSIYWNALKRLGLFSRHSWSQSYYLDHLADHYKIVTAKNDDDGLAHLPMDGICNWDPLLDQLLRQNLETANASVFPQDVDFCLSRKEAEYLRDKFHTLSEVEGPSLLSHLVNEKYNAEFAFPWETPCPPALTNLMNHARTFSMFTKGATLQYHELLLHELRNKGSSGSVETFEQPFVAWWRAARKHLANWNVDDFFSQLEPKCRIRSNDRIFLNTWRRLCLDATDGASLLCNTEALDLIRKRERAVRPVKHRLGQEKYLRQWQAPSTLELPFYKDPQLVPYLLDYRSNVGSKFVNEIVTGLDQI